MSKAVFDTRVFMKGYYSPDEFRLRKLREKIKCTKERYISSKVLHEVYQVTLRKEGRETAKIRTALLEKDCTVIDVNANLAKTSAELRLKYDMSMADSIIATTALFLKAP